jgi:cytochrome c-type biogenesis protein CcmH
MKRMAAAFLFLLCAAPLRAQTSAPSSWPADLVGSDPRLVLGAPAGPVLDGEVLEKGTHDVSSLLRCPVCQGLSVADSPSPTAQNMRRQVRDLLQRGYDRQQVLAYFERSYGEFVRLQPPLRGINWLLWLAPGVVLLAGGAFLAVRSRSRAALSAAAAPPAADPALDPYRERARALAFGDQPDSPESR